MNNKRMKRTGKSASRAVVAGMLALCLCLSACAAAPDQSGDNAQSTPAAQTQSTPAVQQNDKPAQSQQQTQTDPGQLTDAPATAPQNVYVLTTEAFLFGEVEAVTAEVATDGTYYYEDITEDGKYTLISSARTNDIGPEEEPEEYAKRAATSLAKGSVSSVSAEYKEDYTEYFFNPVYVVRYNAEHNGKDCLWTVYTGLADDFTYMFSVTIDTNDMTDLMDVLFDEAFCEMALEEQL